MNELQRIALKETRRIFNRAPTPNELAAFRYAYLLGFEQAQLDESLRLRSLLDTAHVAGEVA